MRKFFALAAVAGAALLIAAPAMAADMPEYPEIPEVDYDIGGSFYLRGSAALNWHWGGELTHPEISETWEYTEYGYGYSWGAGFGYETGTGLRVDGTIDSVETAGLKITKEGMPDPDADGDYTLMLRSTVALANVYYDFGLGGDWGYSSGSGAFGYVGAGAGVAWNHAEVNAPTDFPVQTGTNVSAAGALMVGVGYDMGDWVADLGYRALYIDQVNNAPTADPDNYFEADNNWIHELRGTVRYRFN
jgi:hypothetical protein